MTVIQPMVSAVKSWLWWWCEVIHQLGALIGVLIF